MKEVFREEGTNTGIFRKLQFGWNNSGHHRHHLFSGFLFLILCLTGCQKTKVLNDVVMNQIFSLPLGERELTIEEPPLDAATSRPGPYGTFYYNGRPYPLISQYFHKESRLNFALDSVNKINWIYQLDFKIRVKNTFPSNAYFQVYIMDAANHVTDSVFISGKQKAMAGEVNSLDEVKDTAVSVFETTFSGDRLIRLKQAGFLSYHMYLEAKREDARELRFTNQSNIKVNIAMRLYLKYNINELE